MTDQPPHDLTEEQMLEANTYEGHIWHAQRAIAREELTLAITHLRLSIELQEAIAARGERALVERAGRDAWQKASPAAREQALDRLNTMLRENTVNVPMVGQTRAERPDRVYPTLAAPPIWACDDVKIHPAHQWEEQTESGVRPYRCLGRTVSLAGGRESRPTGPSVMIEDMTNQPIGSRLFAVKAPSWSPEEAHTERIAAPCPTHGRAGICRPTANGCVVDAPPLDDVDYSTAHAPGHSSARRVCAVCGVAWRWVAGKTGDNAYHLDGDGQAVMGSDHTPRD